MEDGKKDTPKIVEKKSNKLKYGIFIVFGILFIIALAIILWFFLIYKKRKNKLYDKDCGKDHMCASESLTCDISLNKCRINPGYECDDSHECSSGYICADQVTSKICKNDVGGDAGSAGSTSNKGVCNVGLILDKDTCKIAINDPCTTDSLCFTNHCDPITKKCIYLPLLGICSKNQECASAYCTNGFCRSLGNDKICPILGKSRCDCIYNVDCKGESNLSCNDNKCGPSGTVFINCKVDADCTGPTGSQICTNGVCMNRTDNCNNTDKQCATGFVCNNTNICVKLNTICNNNTQCDTGHTCSKDYKSLFKFNNKSKTLELYRTTAIPKEATIINMFSCNLAGKEMTFILYRIISEDKNKLKVIFDIGEVTELTYVAESNKIVDISLSYNYLFIFTELSQSDTDDTKQYDDCILYYCDLTSASLITTITFSKVTLEVPRDYLWLGDMGPPRKKYNIKNSLLSVDVLFCKGANYDFMKDKEYVHKHDDLETGLKNFGGLVKNVFVVIVLLIKTPDSKENYLVDAPVGGNMLTFARVGLVNGDKIPYSAWQYRHDTEHFVTTTGLEHHEKVFSNNFEMGKYNKCKIFSSYAIGSVGESSFTKPLAVILYKKNGNYSNSTDSPNARLLHIKIQEKLMLTPSEYKSSEPLTKWQIIKEFSSNKPFYNEVNVKRNIISMEFNRFKYNFIKKSLLFSHTENAYIRQVDTEKFELVIQEFLPIFNDPDENNITVQGNIINTVPHNEINFDTFPPSVSVNYNNEIFVLTNGVCTN